MKPRLIFLASFLGVFILLNGIAAAPSFQKWALGFSKVNYFYISLDWESKLAEARTAGWREDAIAFGSSETVFGWDPQEFGGESRNFGLLASTVEQEAGIARAVAARGLKAKTVFVALNPMMLTSRFIQTTRDADYRGILSLSLLENNLPLSSYAQRWLPVFRYRSVYFDVLKRLLFPSPDLGEFHNRAREAHIEMFFEVDRRANRGHVPAPRSVEPGLGRYLTQSCVEMGKWNFDGANIDAQALEDWRRVLEFASRAGGRVIVWKPPMTQAWRELIPSTHFELMAKEASVRGIEVVDADIPALNAEELFLDCVHLNRNGARALSQFLKASI